MKLIIASLLGVGGGFVAADLPNPQVGECEVADVVERRSEPTLTDPDGQAVGLRLWVAYSDVDREGNDSTRTVDDICALDIDADAAEMIIEASGDIAFGDGDVYFP
jgi:hypothetical protein